MESKTFLALLIGAQTLILLLGIYFISSYLSTQDRMQYEASQEAANQRTYNSTIIHEALFHNLTDLKKGFDPILKQIPNATLMRQEQQLHYNQTTIDFAKIAQVLEIKLQDHKTLNQVNVTVNEILGILKGTGSNDTGSNDTNIPIPAPIVNDDDNGTNPTPQPQPLPGPLEDLENKSIIILPNTTLSS